MPKDDVLPTAMTIQRKIELGWRGTKPPHVARAVVVTDDVEAAKHLIEEEFKNSVVEGIPLQFVVHPEKYSDVWLKDIPYPKLLSVVNNYANSLVLVVVDARDAGPLATPGLMADIVENRPDKDLIKAWEDRVVYLILLFSEDDYKFALETIRYSAIRWPDAVTLTFFA